MAQPLKIVSGFCPYSDGSGYQVSVVIEQEYDDAEPTISIETVYRVQISDWEKIKAGIDRLILALPPTGRIIEHTNGRGEQDG